MWAGKERRRGALLRSIDRVARWSLQLLAYSDAVSLRAVDAPLSLLGLSQPVRSLKYDHYLIADDVRIVTYYAKMSRELITMATEDPNFKEFEGDAWRGVLMVIGALGDWDGVKALVKAREIGVRDLMNTEVNEEGEGERQRVAKRRAEKCTFGTDECLSL